MPKMIQVYVIVQAMRATWMDRVDEHGRSHAQTTLAVAATSRREALELMSAVCPGTATLATWQHGGQIIDERWAKTWGIGMARPGEVVVPPLQVVRENPGVVYYESAVGRIPAFLPAVRP